MNYELAMTRTSVRLYERDRFTRCVDFPNNYELCITHYELFWASTRVRPYRQIQFLRCISQQLRIMNYELRIKTHRRLWRNKKRRDCSRLPFIKILILLIQTQIRRVFRRSTTELYSLLYDKSFKLLICLPLCLSWHQHFQLT